MIKKFENFRPNITKSNLFTDYSNCVKVLKNGFLAHNGKISIGDYLKQCEKYKNRASEEEKKWVSDAILYLSKILPIENGK